MDILKFLNSKDIAKYLKEINYKFSPVETAYVIYQSYKKTLKEKHGAYKELVLLTEDFALKERPNMSGYSSFHRFINDYIKLENEILSEYMKEEDNAIYTYSFYDYEIDDSFNSAQYKRYEEIKGKIQEINDETGFISFVRKTFFYSDKFINVYYNKKGEITKLETNIFNGKINKENLLNAFQGMWINIPIPFRKGDLVCYCKGSIPKDAPIKNPELFVVTDFDYWSSAELEKNGYIDGKTAENVNERDFEWRDNYVKRMLESGDESDMNFTAYYLEKGKILFSETFFQYLNLEYYKGKYNGYDRILYALSNHIKGEIDDEMFSFAYNQIVAEEDLKALDSYSKWYNKDGLKCMGLNPKYSKRKS